MRMPTQEPVPAPTEGAPYEQTPWAPSIRTKLTILVLGVSLVVLLAAGAIMMVVELETHRLRMEADLSTLASVIGKNSTASLSFGDRTAATRLLASLSERPSIEHAWILLSAGEEFAAYTPQNATAKRQTPSLDHRQSPPFSSSHLEVWHQVSLDGRTMGYVVLRESLDEMERISNRYLALGGGIVLGASLLSLLLSAYMQRWISRPIVELTSLAVQVSNHKDYSVRAHRSSADEVGQLADAFNEMLTQIQSRDSELIIAKNKAEQANRDLEFENEVRRQAETKLLEKTNELERSNEELQQFAYVASHDLQEPLRMVTMFSQLIKTRYEDQLDEKGVEYINFAVDGAERMQRLIRELLEFSRVGRTDVEDENVDLTTVLEDVLEGLKFRLEESRGQIEVGDLPEVPGNPTRLFQLFQNLLSNAIKFRSEERPPIVRLDAVSERNFWKFSVRDNGIGMDPAFSDRVFMLFQRLHTRSEFEGTGIGLALCKKIVTTHGGEIGVDCERGTGTTFWFTLPKWKEDPTEVASTERIVSK